MDSGEKKFENNMYWYHWIAIYAMIIAAVAFWIIPEKPLWLGALIVAIGYGAYLVVTRLPRSEMKDL